MKQTRWMSFVESATNQAIGFGISLCVQLAVYAWYGIHLSFMNNVGIVAIFTAASIARSFGLRRMFEYIRVRTT